MSISTTTISKVIEIKSCFDHMFATFWTQKMVTGSMKITIRRLLLATILKIPFWRSRGFIKGRAPGKLPGCEWDLAINLPGCFRLLFLLSFIRKTKKCPAVKPHWPPSQKLKGWYISLAPSPWTTPLDLGHGLLDWTTLNGPPWKLWQTYI